MAQAHAHPPEKVATAMPWRVVRGFAVLCLLVRTDGTAVGTCHGTAVATFLQGTSMLEAAALQADLCAPFAVAHYS